MTEAEYKEAHIALWDWLYHHPTKRKPDWPGWEKNGGACDYCRNYCFACKFCSPFRTSIVDAICEFCPLEIATCSTPGSAYSRWNKASSPKTRKKYAAIIRDAWREGPE